MSFVVILYSILLFFLLTPGILVTLPPKKSKMVVALTHAIIFGIIYHFTHKLVSKLEGMTVKEDISKNILGGVFS